MSSWESLSSDQQEQIRQAFEICDTDGNGSIDLEELEGVLLALGESADQDQAKKLMKEIDLDGNGLISFEEFREESDALQNLSDHYRDIILSYFRFARHQNELQVKEVDTAFTSVAQSRILDTSYTIDEVKDILNAIQTVVQSTVKTEGQNVMHTVVELLRQVFLEADMCGITMKINMSCLENEESISKISKLEQTLFVPKTSKLPSLGKGSLSNDIVSLQKENDTLKHKFSAIQQQFTTMMKEKTNIQEVVGNLKEELEALRVENQILTESLEKEKQRSERQEPQQVSEVDPEMVQKLKRIEEENKSLHDALAKARSEIKVSQKELNAKLNESTQFKNLKKILSTKNEQLKDLRDRLAKHESVDEVSNNNE